MHVDQVRRSLSGVACSLVVTSFLGQATLAQAPAAAQQEAIFRFDVPTQQLVQVTPAELVPGQIYNYYNPRLRRRAWSYLQQDGAFWHALGESTLLSARRFGLDIDWAEAVRQLRFLEPGIGYQITALGEDVYLQLGEDEVWHFFPERGMPIIHDLELQRRWEKHYDRFVPVSHSTGYRWTVRGGRFVPLHAHRLPSCP